MAETRLHPLQEEELRWLAGEDPAEVQTRTLSLLTQEVEALLRNGDTRPASGWSVADVVAHFADIELVMGYRYRRVLSEETPAIDPFDPDTRAATLRYADRSPQDSLEQFRGLRRANIALWRDAAPPVRARVGVHAERGLESFDLMFRMTAGHDRIHLSQIAELKGARA